MTTISPTPTQPEIEWESVNEVDELEVQERQESSTSEFAGTIDILLTIGSTTVYGIYQLCTSSAVREYNYATLVNL